LIERLVEKGAVGGRYCGTVLSTVPTQLRETVSLLGNMDRRVSEDSLATRDNYCLVENSPVVGNEDSNSCVSDSLSVQELSLEDSGRIPFYCCTSSNGNIATSQGGGQHLNEAHRSKHACIVPVMNQSIQNTYPRGYLSEDGQQQQSSGLLEQLQLIATTTASIQLRSIPEQRFVDEFADAMTLLYDFGLLSSSMYPELERHYTECFSHPDEICFVVYHTDRHSFNRQHPYANQNTFDLVGVDLTKTMYTLLDLPSLLRIKQMATVAEPGEVMYVPDTYVHCINALGNVVRKLCDVWVPMVKFNGNMGVFLCALKNTATLLRQPRHLYE
jgi:hypothetical protein